MRRRQFLLTGLASIVATPAFAQEQKADADLMGPIKGIEELWYLLTALDTLIFCLAVAVMKIRRSLFRRAERFNLIPRS